jgi:hypothetical protein
LGLSSALPKLPKKSAHDLLLELTGIDLSRCPRCQKGTMIVIDAAEGVTTGFLMTNSSPNFIGPRSAGLAKVRLRVPKNNSQPAPQRRPNQRKLTPPLYHISLAFYLYPNPVPGHLAHHTIPIVEAARRLCGLVQPFYPPVEP